MNRCLLTPAAAQDLTPPGTALRFITVAPRFLIVYRPDQNPVEIIRVIDASRDVAALLRDTSE